MPAISMRQFRVSRHVDLESLHDALARRYPGKMVSIGALERWESRTQSDQKGRHLFGTVGSTEVKKEIESVHFGNAAGGVFAEVAAIRAPQSPRLTYANETPADGLGKAMAVGVSIEGGIRVASITLEDYAPFWRDEAVSIDEILNLFDLSLNDALAMAITFGLPVPKPYREKRDDLPDPALDGLTAAQRPNSAYRRSNDEARIAVARFLEARHVDRAKLIRLYDTHPTSVMCGWVGSTSAFYIALGVMDIPLRSGGHYSMTDHPEEFPPEPYPRQHGASVRSEAPVLTGEGKGGVRVIVLAPEQEQIPEPVVPSAAAAGSTAIAAIEVEMQPLRRERAALGARLDDEARRVDAARERQQEATAALAEHIEARDALVAEQRRLDETLARYEIAIESLQALAAQ